MAQKTYSIVRHFGNGRTEVISKGLSLRQAQSHCLNPECSSKTAETRAALELTAKHGDWFDGVTIESDACETDCDNCENCCGCC